MAEHLDKDELDRERVSAIALRLINLGWFRVGSDRYVRGSGTYGITTLTRRHVTIRGHRITLAFRGKHKIQVRTSVVDEELAVAMRELLAVPGGARVFRHKFFPRRFRHCRAMRRATGWVSRAGSSIKTIR